MRSTITERGQTVIPAEIRRKFHLSPADRLEWVLDGDGIRVVPVRDDPVAARLLEERRKDQAAE